MHIHVQYMTLYVLGYLYVYIYLFFCRFPNFHQIKITQNDILTYTHMYKGPSQEKPFQLYCPTSQIPTIEENV